MNIAVFAVDPGGASGCAWGIYNPGAKDVWDQLRTVVHAGAITVHGDARTQIAEISNLWSSFFSVSVKRGLLPPERVFFVIEDFIYSAHNNYSGESAMISTAIIWGIEGYRMGRVAEFLAGRRKSDKQVYMPPMVLQTASQAKAFATARRFKDNDLWERGYAGGREHEFSAKQHIAYFLQKYRTSGAK